MATEGWTSWSPRRRGTSVHPDQPEPVTGTLPRADLPAHHGHRHRRLAGPRAGGMTADQRGGLPAHHRLGRLVGLSTAMIVNRSDAFSPFHLLVGLDALVAAVALTAGRLALTHPATPAGPPGRWRPSPPCLSRRSRSIFLLALPDGRLPGTGTTWGRRGRYVLALGQASPWRSTTTHCPCGRGGELVAGRRWWRSSR